MINNKQKIIKIVGRNLREVTCKFKIFLTSKGDKEQIIKHQNKPLELKVRDIEE
jgi:hypothetical protein